MAYDKEFTRSARTLTEGRKQAPWMQVAQAGTIKIEHKYGIFHWRGDGHYYEADTLDGKFYKSEKIAQRVADRLNGDNPEANGNWVVRSFPVLEGG